MKPNLNLKYTFAFLIVIIRMNKKEKIMNICIVQSAKILMLPPTILPLYFKSDFLYHKIKINS